MKRMLHLLTVLGTAVALVSAPALVGRASAATPAAPTDVRLFPGGGSVAVLWNPATGTSPARYTVYRSGTSIATVQAVATPSGGTSTQRYYDTGAVVGQTYTYQVRMTATDGTVSALTGAVQITVPSTVAVPTVQTSTTQTALQPQLDQAAAAVRTWYPKFAYALVHGQYTVPPSVTITTFTATDTNGDGVLDPVGNAYTIGSTIYMWDLFLSGAAATDANLLAGTTLHEMAHVLQQYPGGVASWTAEGGAVLATHEIYADAPPAQPTATQYYVDGYQPMAYLIDWTAENAYTGASAETYFGSKAKRLGFARDLQTQSHSGVSTSAFFLSRTSKSLHDLWVQATGYNVSRTKYIGSSSQCIEPWYGHTDASTALTIAACWETNVQVFPTSGNTTAPLSIGSMCVQSMGGSTVQLQRCVTGQANQQWTYRSDGTLYNAAALTCLQPDSGSAVEHTALVLASCNTATVPSQKWTVQVI